jgi:Fe2+ or Zn2+ uptake regulation protein
MRKKEHIEHRVAEIISTEKRQEIMNVIMKYKDEFTVANVYGELKSRNVDIKITAVLNVIKTLHYAGFLSEKAEIKETGQDGRPRNLYRVVAEAK